MVMCRERIALSYSVGVWKHSVPFVVHEFSRSDNMVYKYALAQLQLNVHTCLECVHKMCPEGAQDASMQVQNLMIKLEQELLCDLC